MQKQVITISGKRYATGLFWQPVESGKTPRSSVSGLSKLSDKNFSLFVTYRNMIGLGIRKLGHRPRMESAATEIAESFAEYSSFLACFMTPSGYWVVAVRNGIIIADTLYENDVDAKNAYFPLSSFPDWGLFIAPNDWKFPRAIEKPLEDLVSGNTEFILKPTSNLKTYLFTALFFILFLLGVFMIFRGPISRMMTPRPHASKINPELVAEFQKRLEEKKAEINTKLNLAKVEVPKIEYKLPFQELPDVYQRAEFCWKGIGYLMQPIPGWVQLNADCDADTASVRLRRSYGTIADLYAVAPELMRGSEITELSDSDVMLRVYLPILDTSESVSEMDADGVMREVNSIFQLIGTESEVTQSTEEIMQGESYVFVNFVKISAKSKLKPAEFVKVFDTLDGVSVQKISWDAAKKIWNYEVRIYVKQ